MIELFLFYQFYKCYRDKILVLIVSERECLRFKVQTSNNYYYFYWFSEIFSIVLPFYSGMSDSQRYPLNLYLINDVKDIVVFHIFLQIVSEPEMFKLLYKKLQLKIINFQREKLIYHAFFIRKRYCSKSNKIWNNPFKTRV